jgi:hypothetical protein
MTLIESHRSPGILPNPNVVHQPPAMSFYDIYPANYSDATGVPLNSNRDKSPEFADIDYRMAPGHFHNSPSRSPGGEPHPTVQMSHLEHERLVQNFPQMLKTLMIVRTAYLQRAYGPDADLSTPLRPTQAREMLQGLMFLPHYLVNRSQNPVAPHGVLPPVFVVLSNSASGSIGAIGGYLNEHEENLAVRAQPLNVGEAIDIAERDGTMVSKNGMCVASRSKQDRFLTTVVNGAPLRETSFDPLEWFTFDEIPRIIAFGTAMEAGSVALASLVVEDKKAASLIDKDITKDRNPRRIKRAKEEAQKFLIKIYGLLSLANMSQHQINIALGRQPFQSWSLDSLEPHDFKTPKVLRKLRSV